MSEEDHYLKKELYNLVRSDPRIFDFLQEGSLDGIWYWDMKEMEQEWMSPRFKTVFGYEDHEIPNTSMWWQENIHPDDLPPVLERAQAHLADPQVPYDQVVRYRHKDGSTVWVRCRGLAIRDESGAPIRMLGCHTDVTSLKRAEAKVTRQNAELVSKNEELARFAFVASHDLQEPLRKVATFGELLAEEIGDAITEEARSYLDIIIDGTTRMQALVHDLLEYARLGKHEIKFESIPLGELLGVLELELDERPDHWSVDETEVVVRAHRSMCNQLLLNLARNAIKYGTRDGESRVAIEIEPRESEGLVEVRVRDNGIGIAAEHQEKIFEIFQRLHAKNEYPGTGIGLAVCERIVELHGGTIGVRSAPDEGSTFWFTLRLARASA